MKISINELLFLPAYFIWVFTFLFSYTVYAETYPGLMADLWYLPLVSIALLLVKQLINLKYQKYQFIFLLVLVILFFIVAMQSSRILQIISILAFIASLRGVSIKKVLGVHTVAMFLVLAMAYFGYQINIIENIELVSYSRSGVMRERSSEGFAFATYGANLVFHLTCLIIYLRNNKIRWIEILGLFVLNYYFFVKTDTKNAFTFSVISLIVVVWLKLKKTPLTFENRVTKFLDGPLIFVIAAIPILSSLLFSPVHSWWIRLDELLSYRLTYGNLAIERYGFHLLANRIEWQTANWIKLNGGGSFLYVDSSYLNILLNFGLIFFICLIISYYYVPKKNTYRTIYFTVAMVAINVHAMWDPQLLELWYNPFLLFLGVLYSQSKQDLQLAYIDVIAGEEK